MKLHIELTPEDIRNGRPRDCRLCPFALAARRAVAGSGLTVTAGLQLAFYDPGSDFLRSRPAAMARLPQAQRYQILDYDQGRTIEPCEFDVEIPDDLLSPRTTP